MKRMCGSFYSLLYGSCASSSRTECSDGQRNKNWGKRMHIGCSLSSGYPCKEDERTRTWNMLCSSRKRRAQSKEKILFFHARIKQNLLLFLIDFSTIHPLKLKVIISNGRLLLLLLLPEMAVKTVGKIVRMELLLLGGGPDPCEITKAKQRVMSWTVDSYNVQC